MCLDACAPRRIITTTKRACEKMHNGSCGGVGDKQQQEKEKDNDEFRIVSSRRWNNVP